MSATSTTGNIPTTTIATTNKPSFPIGDRNAGQHCDQTEPHALVTWLHAPDRFCTLLYIPVGSLIVMCRSPALPQVLCEQRKQFPLFPVRCQIANERATQGDKVTFSAASGTLTASIKDADLQLGHAVRLALGTADLKLSFACPSGSPDSCRPVQVSLGSPVTTIGVISPLTLVTKGGSYDLGSVGSIKLDRGEVSTGALDLDSRRVKAPVTGNIIRVQLNVSAQTIQLYPGFQLETSLRTVNQNSVPSPCR